MDDFNYQCHPTIAMIAWVKSIIENADHIPSYVKDRIIFFNGDFNERHDNFEKVLISFKVGGAAPIGDVRKPIVEVTIVGYILDKIKETSNIRIALYSLANYLLEKSIEEDRVVPNGYANIRPYSEIIDMGQTIERRQVFRINFELIK